MDVNSYVTSFPMKSKIVHIRMRKFEDQNNKQI